LWKAEISNHRLSLSAFNFSRPGAPLRDYFVMGGTNAQLRFR
jgi:hypothetical protein